MDRELTIKDYVGKNVKPDPDKVMNLIEAYSTRKKGELHEKFYYPLTGKVFTDVYPDTGKDQAYWDGPCKEYVVRPVRQGCNTFALYANYVDEYEMLEMAIIWIKGDKPDRSLNCDKREWDYVGKTQHWDFYQRYFLFKGDSTPYKEDGTPYRPEAQGKFYNKEFCKWIAGSGKYPQSHYTMGEFRKLFDVDLTTKFPSRVDWYYGREEAYKNMVPRKVGEKDKRLEELLKINLKDFHAYESECPVVGYVFESPGSSSYYNTWVSVDNYCVFEKISDTVGVFRTLRRNYGKSYSRADMSMLTKGDLVTKEEPFDYESYRVYVDGDQFHKAYYDRSAGTFKKDTGMIYRDYGIIMKNYDDMFDLKYLADNKKYIDRINTWLEGNKYNRVIPGYKVGYPAPIIATLRSNVLKAMIDHDLYGFINIAGLDTGCGATAKYLVESKSKTTKSDITEIFKLSETQLKKINQEMALGRWEHNEGRNFRIIYGNDAASMSDDDAELIIPVIYPAVRKSSWLNRICPHGHIQYSWYRCDDVFTSEEKEFAHRILKLYATEGEEVLDEMYIIGRKYAAATETIKKQIYDIYKDVASLADIREARVKIDKV